MLITLLSKQVWKKRKIIHVKNKSTPRFNGLKVDFLKESISGRTNFTYEHTTNLLIFCDILFYDCPGLLGQIRTSLRWRTVPCHRRECASWKWTPTTRSISTEKCTSRGASPQSTFGTWNMVSQVETWDQVSFVGWYTVVSKHFCLT